MLISMSNIWAYAQAGNCTNKGRIRPLEEGEQLFLAGHILGCGFEGEGKIVARCMTSKIAEQPHKIHITFEDFSNYKKWCCNCSCKAGAGQKCKHIIATLFYIYKADEIGPLSCTDVAQVWGKRKKEIVGAIKSVEEFCHVPGIPSEEYATSVISGNAFLLECIKAAPESEAALHMKMRHDEKEIALSCIREEELHFIHENASESVFNAFLYNLDLDYVLKSCCIKTYNEIYPCDSFQMCLKTLRDDKVWLEARKLRITGTRCYGLYTYGKNDWRNKSYQYFFGKPFKGNDATMHGNLQEPYAFETYQEFIAEWGKLVKYGLTVCQGNPWLACSPDGVVLKNNFPDRLVEFKCPLIGSSKTVLECLPHLPYLNKEFNLKKNHSYYTQVQLGMCLLNLRTCDFVIFASYDKSIYIQNIQLDQEFCTSLLSKLKRIFFSEMLPTLCQSYS